MNIHVARTPHFRTRFTHTCCQGQTGSLTVRPDTARCHKRVCLLSSICGMNRMALAPVPHCYTALQNQKTVTAYFSSGQLLCSCVVDDTPYYELH